MTTLTTTLEMSKKLELAGWSKDTYWYHIIPHNFNPTLGRKQDWEHYDLEGRLKMYPAVTITELLEELEDNVLEEYYFSVICGSSLIDLFRSPDKLAEVWLWASKENLLGRDKER